MAVMNHAILRFHVNTGSRFIGHNQNYKDQKIRGILKTVETEMEFPAFLYDVFEGKSYYSSGNFQRVSERYGLKESDYWNPQTPHTSHTLCDCIQMKRYRLLKGEQAGEPRISWVVIPIQSGDVPQAYFCVMESRKFLDFYDEYSMRIAYMMLQGIYEQLAVARDFSHIGLENLVHMVLESRGADSRKLLDQAEQYGISLEQPRLSILFSHDHANYDIRGKRGEMMELLSQSALGRSAHLVFLSRTEGLLLLNPQELGETDRKSLSLLIEDYEERLSRKFQGLNWSFAYCCEKKPLGQVHTVVDKYRRLLKIGGLVAPERTIHNYEDFGILTWLTIPDEELLTLRERFHDLTENEKSRELMQTLRIYLENNMNYSLTAEKLFVNVNTIRRRIEKVNELISIDWDNYFERVKIGIMLQLLQE